MAMKSILLYILEDTFKKLFKLDNLFSKLSKGRVVHAFCLALGIQSEPS